MQDKDPELYDAELSLKLFVVLTRALDAVKKRIEKDIRRYGLNTTEFAVLELLHHKGPQPIQKIGEKVLIASSSITYVVDKLEKKALLARTPSPDDRRITHASLTPEGREWMEGIFPKHRQSVQQIFGGLDVQEKEILIAQLKKLGIHTQGL